MSEPDWERQREELLSWFGALGSDPEKIGVLIFFVVLFFGALGASAFLLWALRRRTAAVSIPVPRWSGVDMCLMFAGWWLLSMFTSIAAALIFPIDPAIEYRGLLKISLEPVLTVIGVLAGGVAGLIVVGGILTLPKMNGQELTVLGIGTGSLGKGAGLGVLVWLAALPAGFAILISIQFTLLLFGVEPDHQAVVLQFQDSVGTGHWSPAIALMFFGVVVAPLVEEFLFRGVIYRWLAHRFGVPLGVTLSALFFGVVHGSIVALVPIACLGALLALVLQRTGNIWCCIALHSIFNFGQFALMIFAQRWSG